jgi:DNA polymerase-1
MEFYKLRDSKAILGLIEWHNQNSAYVGLDTETTGLSYFNDKILAIQISGLEPDSAVFFDGTHLHLLKELKIPVVCHNFRFDFHMLRRAGVELKLLADTMLLDHLLNENNEHGLDAIVQRRYRDNYKDVFWSKNKEYATAPEEEQVEYACKDVIYTVRLYEDTLRDLKNAGVPSSLVKHVHDLALALYETEYDGISLDLPYLSLIGEKLALSISSKKKEMRKLCQWECEAWELDRWNEELAKRATPKGKAGVERPVFNFDSSKQLVDLLYNRLKLPPQKNSKTRSLTADDGALAALEDKHPFIPLLRDYRADQKVFTSFIEGSLEKMHDGRIYPNFNVNGTVTGRISSSNPNMQQLPKHGGIRGIYVPDAGYKFITCDYGQLEVAIAAHFSRDENLLKIIYEGASQHDITAAGLRIPRNTAKTVNFALQYGAGVHKLMKILECSEADAERALKAYWDTYKGLSKFINECHIKVKRHQPLINPFGRQRHFPHPNSLGKWEMLSVLRQAPNSLIQGTGADITNRAFYLVNDALRARGIGKAAFPIHDEIVISCKEGACEEAADILKSIMVGVGVEINLSVPLTVDCSAPLERWEK